MSDFGSILVQRLSSLTGLFDFPAAVCLQPQRTSFSGVSSEPAASSLASEISEFRSQLDEEVDTLAPNGMQMPLPRPSMYVPAYAASGTRAGEDHQAVSKALPPEVQVSNLGPYEAISSLSEEFKYNKSFGQKVKELEERGYHSWRRVRGDGNCFYRAFGFGLLEQIVAAPLQQQRAWATSLQTKLQTLAFQDDEHAEHMQLVHHVSCLANGKGWQETSGSTRQAPQEMPPLSLLFAGFSGPSGAQLDLALVRALRSLAAQCMLQRADDCDTCNGISFRMLCDAQGLGSPEDFCHKVVLPMGVEAESLVMNAIVPALGVSLRVAILDRGDASGLCFEDYAAAGDSSLELPRVHLQLRPGHYDLLYWRDNSDDTLSPLAARRQRPVTFGMDGADCLWHVEPPATGKASLEGSTATMLPPRGAGYGYFGR